MITPDATVIGQILTDSGVNVNTVLPAMSPFVAWGGGFVALGIAISVGFYLLRKARGVAR